MALTLSTPITKSPFPAEPTPAAKPPPAPKPPPKPPAKPAPKPVAKATPLTKPITAPIVATSHPALEPKPVGPKVTTPAHGGASSRLPKKTTGVEPHAKLPPVPAPAPAAQPTMRAARPEPGSSPLPKLEAQRTKQMVASGEKAAANDNIVSDIARAGGLHLPPSLQRSASAAAQSDIPRELHGTGVLEQGLKKGGQAAATGIATGAQALNTGARDIRNAINRAAGFKQERASGRLPGATVSTATLGPEALSWLASGAQQAVNLPAELIPSTVMSAEALVALAKGNPKPVEDMGKQIAVGFTSYEGLKHNWLNDLLIARGTVGSAGRLAYPALKEVGLAPKDLTRPDINPYGSARIPQLDYSKDPVKRLEQRIHDAGASGRVRVNRELARQTSDLYGMASTRWRTERLRIEGERQQAITGRRTPKGHVRQLGTHLMNPTEPVGLLHGPEITGKEATNLIIQGVIRRPDTAVKDLTKLRERIASVEHRPGTDAEKAQAATLGHLDGLIHNKHIDWAETVASAKKSAADLNAYQAELAAKGIVHSAAAERIPLTPYASLHMDAEHGLTPAAVAHDVARKAVSDAQKHLNAAHEAFDAAMSPDRPLHERRSAGLVVALTEKELEGARARQEALKIPEAERRALVHTSDEHGGHPGEVMTNDQIRAHMRANGVNPNDLAYITHKPLAGEPVRWSGMKGHPLRETKRRTMTAFEGGLFDPTHDAVVNQHLKSAYMLHKHDFTQTIINRFVLRKGGTILPTKGQPHGDFRTPAEALKMATDPEYRRAHGVPDSVVLVPFRITEPFMRKSQMTAIKGDLTTHEATFATDRFGTGDHNVLDTGSPSLTSLMPSEVKGTVLDGSEPGAWGLISQVVAKRLIAHEQPDSMLQRLGGSSRSLFARSVLPFSPKRPLGEAQETGLRMGIGRAGVTSRTFLHQQFGAMLKGGPEAKREVENIVAANWGGGGGLAGQAIRAKKFTTNRQYEGTWFERGPDLLAATKRLPAPLILGEAIRGFNSTINGIMRAFSTGEAEGMKAATGKYWYELWKQNAELRANVVTAMRMDQRARMDFAQKYMMNTDHQLASARYTARMMGKWSNQSPLVGHMLTWAPFASWYLNSMQFMYAVLPADHPVLTGAFAAANTGTYEQRAAVGLAGPWADNPNEVPGYQEGGVPIGGGKEYQASYYSPIAVTDPYSNFTSQLFPVEQSLILAGAGLDYTFRYPKNAQGHRVKPDWREKTKMALGTLFGEQVPGFQFVQNVATRPQSFVAPPLRIYNMYPDTAQPTTTGGAGGGGAGGGGAGGGGAGGGGA